MSGGTGQSQNIDPDIKSRQLGLYNDVTSYLNQTPYQSYGGPLVAGQQPFQQAAQNFLGQQLLGYNPGFQPSQTFGPYQAADFTFGSQNPAVDPNTGQAVDPNDPGFIGGVQDQIEGTSNPFEGMDAPWDPFTTAYSGGFSGGFQIQGDPNTQGGPAIQPPQTNVTTGGSGGFPLQDATLRTTLQDVGGGPVTGSNFGFPLNDATIQGPQQPPPGFAPPGFSENTFASGVAQDITGYDPQQVQGGQFTGDRLAQLQNPFQQQVIDQSISDLDRARQIAMQSGPGSTSAGAYGGSRTGVREAETNRAFLDSVARQSAQLRSAGFDRAAGLMGQELGMGLSADLANQRAGLQGAGLNLGAAQALDQFGGNRLNRTMGIGSALNQLGTQNQGLAQRQIDADYGQFQQARNWPLQGFGLQQGVLSGMPVGMNFNPGSNPGAGFAGGALSGAGIGSAFGPWGAGLGALGGGLLGLL